MGLVACGGTATAAPSAGASQAAKPAASAGGGSQANWDALVAAAKKEGKLTLAVAPGGGTAARQAIPPAFKQDFGIDVEVLVGPSSQLVSRLKLEQSSALHTVDVVIGGADTMYQSFYGDKLIAPMRPQLINPDVLKGANWAVGKPWFMDPDQQYILRISSGLTGATAVNTKLVKPSDIASASDLLKPQFKGKLATFDPTINGAGAQHAAYLEYKLGPDFIKKLYVDQQPIKTQDNRQLADWVGRGNYPVAIVMNAVNIEQLKSDGLPVKELAPFKDAPAYLTGGSGLMAEIKGPPHPKAAQLFMNWMALPHGQTVYNRAVQMISPLTTVKSDWAPAYTVPKPGVNYTDSYAWSYVFDTYPKAFAAVRKIVGTG
ncbi:MAG TPA: extracellular solute-binding protein [Chloroflexota bacterium]|nr:extracellular solute-binding protein [Chloroflexota bacterium]